MLLQLLLENQGQVVTKETLTQQLWQNKVVNDEALARLIAELRSALGDSATQPEFIETIPKAGYRFIAEPDKTTINHGARLSSRKQKELWTTILVGIPFLVIAFILQQALNSTKTPTESYAQWRNQINEAKRITADYTIEYQPELSPDGGSVAYVVRTEQKTFIRIQSTISGDIIEIKNPDANLFSPVWSPDEKFIAYAESSPDGCKIKQYNLSSRVSQELLNCYLPNISPVLDWSSDGKTLAYLSSEISPSSSSNIWLYDFASKSSSKLTHLDEAKFFDTRPRFSPDNSRLAFIRGTSSIQNIFMVSLNHEGNNVNALNNETPFQNPEEQLTFNNTQKSSFTWFSNDALIFDSNSRGDRHLWFYQISSRENKNLGAKDAQAPSLAKNSGELVFQEVRYQANLWLQDLQSGDEEEVIASAKYDNHPALSPNDKLMAYSSNRFGYGEIWLYNLEDKTDEKLVSLENQHLLSPSWHPSGKKLLFTSISEARYSCMQLDLTDQLAVSMVTELEIGNCAYLGEDILGISKVSLSRPQLYKVSQTGESQLMAEESISKVMVTSDNKIIFSRPDKDGIYQLLENGEMPIILDDFPWPYSDYWTVAGDYLYYVEREDDFHIWKMNLSTSEKQEVANTVSFAVGSALAASVDGRYLVTSRRGNNKGDLYFTTPLKQK